MSRTLAFGLAALVAMTTAGAAMADNLSYVGVANTVGAGGYQDTGVTNGPASYSSAGPRGSASSSMDLDVPGGRLIVAADAGKQGSTYANALLDYSFHVEAIDGAATNVPLSIGIEATGYTNALGRGGTANISFFVGSFFYDYFSTSQFDPGAKTYTYSHAPIVVPLNYVVNIRMAANAYADGGDGLCTTNCGASAEAWIDPTFTILGPNASNYRIVGVPGPTATPPSGAVPEPSTWALLILGFAGAGSALRRRSSRAPA
jgi:hypothetical protein